MTTGRTEILKLIFLTKNAYSSKTFVAVIIKSEIKFHKIIAEKNQTGNGIFSVKLIFSPTEKTNHKINIIARGCMKAHNNPKIEPANLDLKSCLVNPKIMCLFFIILKKK